MIQFLEAEYTRAKTLHHAYCIEGDQKTSLQKLTSFLKGTVGVHLQGNPDVWCGTFAVFGIKEAHILKEQQSRRALLGGKKFFIILTESMTHEAQNALLKIFEEPTMSTHFFLLLPKADILLPTLLSRLMVIGTLGAPDGLKGRNAPEPKKFLLASAGKRLKMLKKLIVEKDTASAIRFLNALEWELHATLHASGIQTEDTELFESIARSRDYLYDRSPSVKMILENIALSIPRV